MKRRMIGCQTGFCDFNRMACGFWADLGAAAIDFPLHIRGGGPLRMRPMKYLTQLTAMGAAAFLLASCQTTETIKKNQVAAQGWLDAQSAPARINVSGMWFAEGWGKAELKQTGRKVSGMLDTYEVRGVVSGGKACLTAWDSGKCYYAIEMSQAGKNVLKGTYTDGPVYLSDPKQQRAIELRRSY